MFQAWWLGVILIIFGGLSSAFGLVFMKASADTEEDLPFLQRRKWLIGFFCLVVNATIIDLIAYGMTPLTLIAPFAGLQIIFSSVIAEFGWVCKKETISSAQWVAILIVVAGIAVVSSAGPHDSQKVTRDNVIMHLSEISFVIFSSTSVIAIGIAMRQWYLQNSLCESRAFAILVACGAASAGALSQLCLKVVSSCLAAYMDGESLFQLHVAIALSGLLCFAPLQLFLLNSSLMASPVVFAVPLYNSLLTIWTIVAGGTFFAEFQVMDPQSLWLFLLGVLASILGLVVLSTQTHVGSHEEKAMLVQKQQNAADKSEA